MTLEFINRRCPRAHHIHINFIYLDSERERGGFALTEQSQGEQGKEREKEELGCKN